MPPEPPSAAAVVTTTGAAAAGDAAAVRVDAALGVTGGVADALGGTPLADALGGVPLADADAGTREADAVGDVKAEAVLLPAEAVLLAARADRDGDSDADAARDDVGVTDRPRVGETLGDAAREPERDGDTDADATPPADAERDADLDGDARDADLDGDARDADLERDTDSDGDLERDRDGDEVCAATDVNNASATQTSTSRRGMVRGAEEGGLAACVRADTWSRYWQWRRKLRHREPMMKPAAIRLPKIYSGQRLAERPACKLHEDCGS